MDNPLHRTSRSTSRSGCIQVRPWMLCALMLLPFAQQAQAQENTLEGQLETGPTHSVLWFASPESGDLIGQVFANKSQAGQAILSSCLPDLACTLEGSAAAAPAALTEQLRFELQPSGWWQILHARNVQIQGNLPMSELSLTTRFGQLSVTEEDKLLLLNGRPVLSSSAPTTPPTAPPATRSLAAQTTSAADELTTRSEFTEPPAPSGNWLQRLQHWWQEITADLRHTLWALLGRKNSGSEKPPATATQPAAAISDSTAPLPTNPATTAGIHSETAISNTGSTVEAVQGNAYLHIMAHFESEDHDLVLLQSTGGTACPALYRFLTLTKQGVSVTPEFGSCSDLAAISLAPGTEIPMLAMPGFMGPFEAEALRVKAERRLHRYSLQQAHIQEIVTQY